MSVFDKIQQRIPKSEEKKVRLKMLISARIFDFMEERRLSLTDLAVELNVDLNTVSYWLSGTYSLHVDLLQDISEILNVPISELIDSANDNGISNRANTMFSDLQSQQRLGIATVAGGFRKLLVPVIRRSPFKFRQ